MRDTCLNSTTFSPLWSYQGDKNAKALPQSGRTSERKKFDQRRDDGSSGGFPSLKERTGEAEKCVEEQKIARTVCTVVSRRGN